MHPSKHLARALEDIRRPDLYIQIILVPHSENERALATAECQMNAGFPVPGTFKIRVTPHLWEALTHDECDGIILHELAHILAFEAGEKADHGHIWHAICCRLGGYTKRNTPLGAELRLNAAIAAHRKAKSCD